jgi:signal peptidase I
VIGLPGDRVKIKDGVLSLNGVASALHQIDDFPLLDESGERAVRQFVETPPDGPSYRILDETDGSFLDNTPEYLVPPGHVFVLGDNRDDALDSRIADIGFVPLSAISGRASVVWWNRHSGRFGWRWVE